MALDPVLVKAARTPGFIVGAILLIFGVAQFVVVLLANPLGNPAVSGALMWLCAIPGWVLMSRARSRALREWRRGE